MILVLLFFTFNSVKYALLIFTAVPLSAVGGVIALLIRGMPFSISAGVGFIALFGIAVLNGIVLISYYNELRRENNSNIREIVVNGANSRLRPVMMTAITDVLGFLPMAISVSAGAEVQRPLATVVIGGLITSTLLTMIILPILYMIFSNPPKIKVKPMIFILLAGILLVFTPAIASAQEEQDSLDINESWIIENALLNNPEFRNANLKVEKSRAALTQDFNIPATEFTFQRGQINSAIDDRYISVNQSLGSILKNIRSWKLQKTHLAVSEMEKLFIERNIIKESLMAYNNWLYSLQLLSNQQTRLDLFENIISLAERKFQLGDIDLLEKTLLENDYYQMKQKLAILYSNSRIAENKLKNLLYISDTLKHPSSLFYRPLLNQPKDSLMNDLVDLQETYHALINEIGNSQLKDALRCPIYTEDF
jgi:cobalt-zinc-cadmium resistance protein CzcA